MCNLIRSVLSCISSSWAEILGYSWPGRVDETYRFSARLVDFSAATWNFSGLAICAYWFLRRVVIPGMVSSGSRGANFARRQIFAVFRRFRRFFVTHHVERVILRNMRLWTPPELSIQRRTTSIEVYIVFLKDNI